MAIGNLLQSLNLDLKIGDLLWVPYTEGKEGGNCLDVNRLVTGTQEVNFTGYGYIGVNTDVDANNFYTCRKEQGLGKAETQQAPGSTMNWVSI